MAGPGIRWTAGATIAVAIIAFACTAGAATIRQITLTAGRNTVQIDFVMRGSAPQWSLSGHGQELWIDLDHARIAAAARTPDRPIPFPLMAMRVDYQGGWHTRLVLRVSGKVDYAVAYIPHELIVRIAQSGRVPDLGRMLLAEIDQERPLARIETAPVSPASRLADWPPARKPSDALRPINNAGRGEGPAEGVRPVANAPLPLPGSERPLVVIDAGHGGYDPGTRSADGVPEKTLALEIARNLEAALAARGIRAELTRDRDTFLSLAERTELANRVPADLFISIHLNWSPDRATSGIETYYLNNTNDRATIRLARMENQGSPGYGAAADPDLEYILTNLRQDYKANESASLAQMIEVESASTIQATLGIRVNPLGAKKGPFYVLVGARMPSVLVECGFLSNPVEAQRLTEPDYQRALADGIATAVVHYFNADAAVGNL